MSVLVPLAAVEGSRSDLKLLSFPGTKALEGLPAVTDVMSFFEVAVVEEILGYDNSESVMISCHLNVVKPYSYFSRVPQSSKPHCIFAVFSSCKDELFNMYFVIFRGNFFEDLSVPLNHEFAILEICILIASVLEIQGDC